MLAFKSLIYYFGFAQSTKLEKKNLKVLVHPDEPLTVQSFAHRGFSFYNRQMKNMPFKQQSYNLNDLPNGVLFEPPKKFKTRPPTQLGSLLIPVKFKKKLLEKYVLVSDKTEIKVFGQQATKEELNAAISEATRYFVKGTANAVNIVATHFNLY